MDFRSLHKRDKAYESTYVYNKKIKLMIIITRKHKMIN